MSYTRLQDGIISSRRISDIEKRLKEGNIDLANQILNFDDIVKRRNTLESTSQSIAIELKFTSKEFLLKAKTVQLQIDNPNRLNEAYISYKESIKTFHSFSNTLEFANFLKDYNLPEYIEVSKEIIELYSDQMSKTMLADLITEIAHTQSLTRNLDDSLESYISALTTLKQIDQDNLIKDLNVVIKISECQKNIAFILSQFLNNEEAEKYYEEAFMHFNSIDNLIDVFAKQYANLLEDYSSYLILQKGNKSLTQAFNLALTVLDIRKNICTMDDDGRLEVSGAFIHLAGIQNQINNAKAVEDAQYNYFLAKKILNGLNNRYTSSNIGMLSITHHGLSRTFEQQGNTKEAIKHMHDAISYMHMRFEVVPQEAKENAAIFCIELSDLYKEVKNYNSYLEFKFEVQLT